MSMKKLISVFTWSIAVLVTSSGIAFAGQTYATNQGHTEVLFGWSHTGVEALDRHLKSKDFLEVETYPEITFQSTSISKTGDNSFDVTGDLTIHGVTNSVTLKTDLTFQGSHPLGKFFDAYKGAWVAFRATTEIDHRAFKVVPILPDPSQLKSILN